MAPVRPTGAVGRRRLRLEVEGTVQGVGFRPYVHRLARDLGLSGIVGNDGHGVFIEVEGPGPAVQSFHDRLPRDAPPLAAIERLRAEERGVQGDDAFVIVPSDGAGSREALVAPDVATCDACLAELFDPADRRAGYPFINCTDCGPRYSIVRDVPYDRPSTTMAGFAMCPRCDHEYHDPTDRRFHAQPVCCRDCGPQLQLLDRHGDQVAGEPVTTTTELLRAGAVVAVKGLGGYHLAVAATDPHATRVLRDRKHREEKPFAILAADLAAAEQLVELSPVERGLLASPEAPIVLARRRTDAAVADAVAPGQRALGVMLPSTPLHHLLARAHGTPLVLTSGNVSDEPIAYEDTDARARLGRIADAFLTHDRPIHVRVDDSVTRVVADGPVIVRRARGYTPRPFLLRRPAPRHVLACGAELKSTVCVGKAGHAFVSQHLGDLENHATYVAFTQAVDGLCRLFDVRPELVAHDLHPEYLSTKWALELAGVDTVAVQHHHAHVASCLVDNGEVGPVIGVAFDGTGYGTDGTLWGGEFLVSDLTDFVRVGHLDPVPLPGGTAAIREPWRSAVAYLDVAFEGTPPPLAMLSRNHDRVDAVRQVARSRAHAPLTSSVGRLFDAVAAILGVRDAVTYEGQAAIELEQLADPHEVGTYPTSVPAGDQPTIAGAALVAAVTDDLTSGTPTDVVAARFHRSLAAVTVACCQRIRSEHGLGTVALSGGVFQNVLLLGATVSGLQAAGFRVLTHHRVPPNDGGISLGQLAVAAARDHAGGIRTRYG